MKFKDLRMLSNARFYDLEVYSKDGGSRVIADLDVEDRAHKVKLYSFADAKVVRFQPIINDNGCAALEVELYINDNGCAALEVELYV